MHFLAAVSLVFAIDASAQLTALEARLSADAENLKIGAEYRQAIIAADDNDRAIKFFDRLAKQPGAGPHAFLNLGLAYLDKIPSVGAFRRISIGNNATAALTHSIEREPSDLAYLIRGLVNLHFEKGPFHRTPDGVADLENALRLAEPHHDRLYVARIYLALGDGYWRLKNPVKAREVWRDGQTRFPANDRLRSRLASPDADITETIAKELDASVRVDTSLKDVLAD